MMKKYQLYLLMAIVLLSMLPVTAHAYIDPGTGSMILQALGVIFIAVSGAFVVFKNRISAYFKRRKGLPVDDNTEKDDDV